MKKRFFATFLPVFLFTACAPSDYNAIAEASLSKHPSAAFENLAKRKTIYYINHPKQLQADIKFLLRLKENIAKEWGDDNVVLPKRKETVKYLQNYKSRALIDFSKGIVRVETIGTKEELKKAIVTTLLLPEDPSSVDLFSAKDVKLGGVPYLYGEVKDDMGKNIRYQWRANRYANILLAHNYRIKTIKRDGKSVRVHYVEIPMVRDHADIRVAKFKPYVKQYANRFKMEEALVYAVIQTESDFNQYAVSGAGAYGLMQIVPRTAGRDAYLYVKKRDHIPSKQYLFNAKNNIELGVAYLRLLDTKHFAAIKNPLSREYCIISAYNTGSGNVLKVFHKDRYKAQQIINRLSPRDVYIKLRNHLPYMETRNYLQKVVNAKKRFVKI